MNIWELFYTDDAISQAERLAAAGIGIQAAGNIENLGPVVDDVLAEIGFPLEGIPVELGPTYERTRSLVVTLAGFASLAVAYAATARRQRDDREHFDLADVEADRRAQVEALGDVERLIRDIRATNFRLGDIEAE